MQANKTLTSVPLCSQYTDILNISIEIWGEIKYKFLVAIKWHSLKSLMMYWLVSILYKWSPDGFYYSMWVGSFLWLNQQISLFVLNRMVEKSVFGNAGRLCKVCKSYFFVLVSLIFRIQEKDVKLKSVEESLQAAQASSSTMEKTVEVWAFLEQQFEHFSQRPSLV